jgi:cob(I)alamin adenosyltransferase
MTVIVRVDLVRVRIDPLQAILPRRAGNRRDGLGKPCGFAVCSDYSVFELKNMGNRLSKIATRTGDNGTTGLGDGSRTGKDSLRIAAIGDVDELNSHIGLLLCEDLPANLREELLSIQHDLFDLGGELCIPGYQLIKEAQVARLDTLLEKYNADLPALKDFILPGGSRAAAQSHVCRTVCRRAERAIVALGKTETIHPNPRHYVNRLSDLLFVLSRVLNRHAGGSDVQWQKERDRDT